MPAKSTVIPALDLVTINQNLMMPKKMSTQREGQLDKGSASKSQSKEDSLLLQSNDLKTKMKQFKKGFNRAGANNLSLEHFKERSVA